MNTKKSIFYPPGGILIWLLVIIELFTFIGAALVFVYYKKELINEHQEYQEFLSSTVGSINTVVLITSGYFMALSLTFLRKNLNKQSSKLMIIGILLGLLFLIIKSYEFYSKLELGIGLNYNTFFTLYWMMTGFHYIHVLFGVGLLFFIQQKIKNKTYSNSNIFDVEASISYWHMCDLIWLLIFPILYLL